MEVAGAAAGDTTKHAIVHLERELGYLVHFKRNVNNLKIKIQQLSAAADDLRSLIDVALNNNERIRVTVQAWLRRAETLHEEATQLIDEAGHISSWFIWWCCSRFSLGRKAEKKVAVIQGLLEERSTIGDNVSIPKLSHSLELVSAGDFSAFSSRESTTKQVIESLRSDKISLVGVFGMPGVGKTMLIQAIAKKVKEERLFQEVLIVTVSQNHILERIQGDVANGLDLNLHAGDTSFTRAARLSERINQGNTILIVLDDVWERLDFAAVGIGLKSSNSHCKVIFTTRDISVCNHMEADESIEVTVLPREDSWTLFRQKVGNIVDFAISPRISGEIVEQCKGLPLAIVTIGLALRNIDDELIWKDTLTQLKKSVFEGMTPVVSSIRLSYDFLKNNTVKLCFLFCCLFPEDYKIDSNILLRYLIGENLLQNVDSLEEARGRLQSLVGKLASSNLLIKDKHGYIMMHDVVRDVAISIASEDDRLGFIVKAGMGFVHWPILELSNCKRMSVMKNEIIRFDISNQIRAPHLITLSMRNNRGLKDIPDDLFSEMENLLTLDLSCTGIISLPTSLLCLLNLRTLLIEGCELRHISPVQKLERLEVLSFHRSSVQRNPEDIKNWSFLKLLDLSESTWYDGISKVLSSLFRLEELYMCKGNTEEVLSHIEALTRLNALELPTSIPTSFLSRDIPNWENLARFKLCISNEMDDVDLMEVDFQRIIRLEMSSSLVIANWVKVLVAKTEALLLVDCEGIESPIELDGTGLNELKWLHFQGSTTTKYLINTVAEMTPKFVFSRLEELIMSYMDSFESFCLGMLPDGFLCKLRSLRMLSCTSVVSLIQVDLLMRLQNLEDLEIRDCTTLENLIQPEEQEDHISTSFMSNNSSARKISNCPLSPSFPNLRSLEIWDCPLLEHVFSLSVAQGLLKLSELKISSCASIKTIFANDTGEDMNNAKKDKHILPRLKTVWLIALHELSTFTLPGMIMHCPSLEELEIARCQNLKRFPFCWEDVPKLQRLVVELEWFNELEWEDEGDKSHMWALL